MTSTTVAKPFTFTFGFLHSFATFFHSRHSSVRSLRRERVSHRLGNFLLGVGIDPTTERNFFHLSKESSCSIDSSLRDNYNSATRIRTFASPAANSLAGARNFAVPRECVDAAARRRGYFPVVFR